jgi:RHS repeat-associated protein
MGQRTFLSNRRSSLLVAIAVLGLAACLGAPSAGHATEPPAIELRALNSEANAHHGIDYHPLLRKLVVSANTPFGTPHNFELIASDGGHSRYSNLSGVEGDLIIAVVRKGSAANDGRSLGGFLPGEMFFAAARVGLAGGGPRVIAKVSPDGSLVHNPWVSLPPPDSSGGAVEQQTVIGPPPGGEDVFGGLHVDTTGVFGGDLIAVTGLGEVWRINSAGVAKRIAEVGAPLRGLVVVPDDPDRYGPWAGRVVSTALDNPASIVAVDVDGAVERFSLRTTQDPDVVSLETLAVDFEIVPPNENFFGVEGDGEAQRLVAAPAQDFSGMVGDILLAVRSSVQAFDGSGGFLSRVTWNGTSFVVTDLAGSGEWKQITFAPAGIETIPSADPRFDKIAVVRHAPVLNSGRIEGTLWQLLGEPLTLNGTDTITVDLLVPGTPTVEALEAPFFDGVVPGTGSTEPSGYPISIGGRATLRHLVTRTDPIELPPVADPPFAAGTVDVPDDVTPEDVTDWSAIRDVELKGNDGEVAVPPGTYGQFSATGRTTFVLGVAGATSYAVYNLEELQLGGGSELRLVGPVLLTVRGNVTLGGGTTAGDSESPRDLLLRLADGGLTLSGTSVLYAIVRAPEGEVVVEWSARLRGTVACDRLTVSGDGVIEVTETDLVPAVNRPPLVDAGPDQTTTLPEDTVELAGAVSDDGLPANGQLTASWSVASGPGSVVFAAPTSATTKAAFTAAGTYALRLTASDSLLTSSDETTITVVARNQAPVVVSGEDQEVTLPNTVTLSATVTDDGLPVGSTLTFLWSVASGPGPVTFENADAPSTTASFSVPGVYVLRLTVGDGEFEVADTVTITVHASNQPPEVSAGPDQMITPPLNTIHLHGLAIDDGVPSPNSLSVNWSQVSGPVTASIHDPTSAVTTATFTAEGTYVLRLTASDTQFTVSDDVEISVGCADTRNKLDIVLVIDRSGSMLGQPLANAKTAAKAFLDNLDPTLDRVSVVSFAFTPILHQPLTGDYAAVKAAIDTITIDGGTDIAVGITTAQAELTSERHDPQAIPIMIVLSDFESTAGNTKAAADAAKAAGTRIIALAIFASPISQMFDVPSSLNDLYISPSVQDLAWVYRLIAGSFCRNDTPLVRAGEDFAITLPNDGRLLGEVHDDGLPANGRLTSTWRVVSGPGTVTLFDPSAPVTTAIFSVPGVYELELTATDSIATASDRVVVTVNPEPSLENAFLSLVASGSGRYVIGTTVSLTATLRNASAVPIAGFPINFTVSGPNARTASAVTDANGVATFALKGTNTGTDSVEAKAVGRTITASSGVVTLEWTTEVPPGTTPPVPSTLQGWIGGPLHLSLVSGQVPITLGAGITLSEGVVEYWSVSTPTQVTVLASNVQAGPGATIATLDTTLIANGSYIVRLRGRNPTVSGSPATAAAGASRPAGGQAGPPVQVRTLATRTLTAQEVVTASELVSDVMVIVVGENKPGRIVVTSVDFTIPLSGLPITIARKYDSLDRLRSGDFGHGWSLEFGTPRLEVNPANGVTITDPGTGQRVFFAFTPREFGVLFLAAWRFPAFTPEPGVFGTLHSDGCSLLRMVDGQAFCAFGVEPFKPTTYRYTDPEGRAYTITADGLLRSATDLNGNTLTFSKTSIASNAGVTTFLFNRDAKGRIQRIADNQGRDFFYTYDTAGDLVAVKLPGILTPIEYDYDGDHRYLSTKDPRGHNPIIATYYPDGRLETITNAVGDTTRYAYDLVNNTTTTTNPDGGVVVERFNAVGLPVSRTDELSHTTEWVYNASNRLEMERNALGQITRYGYDEAGNPTSRTDHANRSMSAIYGEFGRPVALRDELGRIRTFLYDANFNVVGIADKLGPIVSMTIDDRGNPMTITDANGETSFYNYNSFGNLAARSDALGNTTRYLYSPMGKVEFVEDPLENGTTIDYDTLDRVTRVRNALSQPTIFEYDAAGNLTSKRDALSRITSYEYDAANRLSHVRFHDTTSVSFTYDFRGNVLKETDQLLRTTEHEYDKAGRHVRTRFFDGSERRYGYDDIGRLTSVTDERDKTTRFEYDPGCACPERVTKVINALDEPTTIERDAAGRIKMVKDAAGRETRLTFDDRDRLTEIAYPDSTTVAMTYDNVGRLRTEKNESGKFTRYDYDEVGNLVAVTDPLEQTTRYTYDGARNLTVVTDATLIPRTFLYDRLNRVARQTIGTRFETYGYDAVGNLTGRRDFNGRLTTYTYDARNRLLSRRPDTALGEPTVSFTYTKTGARETMTDATGTTVYGYDDRDRLLTKQTPHGTLVYTYDPAGNVASLRSSSPDGVALDYAYDDLNRLESVVEHGPTAGTTSYTFDAAGRLASETAPNGVRTAMDYSDADWVTGLTISKGGATLAAYSYEVGPTGLRVAATEHGGRQVAYSHDDAERLVGETITGAAVAAGNGAASYTLDAAGNRLVRQSTLAGVPSVTHTYQVLDRLVGDTYNNNGNTTASGGKTFAYNFENRLRSVNGGAITFAYDGDGNRVRKTVGGVTTTYLVDELSPSGYPQVVEEAVGGAVQRVVTHGLGLIGQRRPVAGGWAPSYFGLDAHGSVRLLTNAAGAVTDTYDYDAFGILLASSGSTPNSHLYSGEQFDADLGAYYLRQRYYNPERGRFFTPDPFAGFLDDPPSQRPYLYVGADPVNWTDPTGFGRKKGRYTVKEQAHISSRYGVCAKFEGAFELLAGVWEAAGWPTPETHPDLPWEGVQDPDFSPPKEIVRNMPQENPQRYKRWRKRANAAAAKARRQADPDYLKKYKDLGDPIEFDHKDPAALGGHPKNPKNIGGVPHSIHSKRTSALRRILRDLKGPGCAGAGAAVVSFVSGWYLDDGSAGGVL